MIDLVSARTELRKAGARSYSGICPFHEERSPSFSVEPVEKLYHCFGCQAGGDAFKFVQEIEGVGFNDAVELLAQRYGVQLEVEAEDPRDAERRLAARAAARAAGAHRGVLRPLPLGLPRGAARPRLPARARAGGGDAARVPRRLRAERVGQGAARLAARRRSPTARSTTPASRRGAAAGRSTTASARGSRSRCATRAGGCSGFGARAMGEARGAKYVNTPENDIFHKGRVLFGVRPRAGAAPRAPGRVIAVEGYTDVLALHQAGLRNCVGIMGTALTEDQVGELSRLAQVVLLALDSDSAGHEAMLRAARVAEGRKLELRVVRAPAGQGPGGHGRRGRWRRAAHRARRRLDARSCASASSGRWRPATFATQRARTTSSRSSGPCSRRSPPSVAARGAALAARRPAVALARARGVAARAGPAARRAGTGVGWRRPRAAPAARAGARRARVPGLLHRVPRARDAGPGGARPRPATSRRSRRAAWRPICATTA